MPVEITDATFKSRGTPAKEQWPATTYEAKGSRSYVCGFCGHKTASNRGWKTNQEISSIFICTGCNQPTYFDASGTPMPGVAFGESVDHIDEKSVEQIYNEARICTGVGAYTAATLCCRKLLMHVAVDKGAKSGETFAAYIQYLLDHHYLSPDYKDWVDRIRKDGNEANHEIVIKSQEEAERILAFCEMLLKVIYEFPARAK